MNDNDTTCHNLSTIVKDQTTHFFSQLNSSNKASSEAIYLNLDSSQIRLKSALDTSNELSKVIILDQSAQQCHDFTNSINEWSKLLNVNHNWHTITGKLTPQEIDGTVSSSLSQTIHHFLSGSKEHHFVLPVNLLETLFPESDAYRKLSKPLHVGEKAPSIELIKSLVDLGYIRYDKSLETGGFRVRGEQIDIQHSSQEFSYTVTLYRENIESITRKEGKQNITERSLSLLPIKLPDPTIPLGKLLTDRSISKPNHLEITGEITTTYDSLDSEHQFPITTSANPLASGKNHFILYENHERVKQFLDSKQDSVYQLCKSPLAKTKLQLETEDFTISTEASLLPTTESKPISYQKGLTLIAKLYIGKPAVHSDHGIGIYEGLQTRNIDGHAKEYLILQYAAGDTLSVPVEYAYKVTAYLGDTTPTLYRLNSTTWKKHKKKAQIDAARFAKELLGIASKRHQTQREAYQLSETTEAELDQTFEYDLTPDQAKAWSEIKHDLEQDLPMDRLVVGDVGFGKTELAVRAARHTLDSGKQVAVLAPTTLLVQQHTDTFTQRLSSINQRIGTLSRFATSKEQDAVREKITNGELDIVIGTHALLSNKTKWKDLGLVIIDEEQKFGVKHKEHFKKVRANLDLLSLSATPIPRTLSMALSGIKKLSIISTPPTGRKGVKSTIRQDDDKVLHQAITTELERSGQVYVVSPTVKRLHAIAYRVDNLIPNAKLAIAHGQLPAKELAETMKKFDNQEIDILISSTIIESGIDLPNANTIIVTQATHFGLAELYQLRGRVGRRKRQGYAYFLYNHGKLTNDQKKRLTALTEASRLGSGWSLAQRDLEIRGAGNMLGAEQSGSVNAIGAQLYLDLVNDAINQSDQATTDHRDVDIQLPIEATIPPEYIADIDTRATYYQQLSRASSIAELKARYEAMTAKYGAPTKSLNNFRLLLLLQHVAAEAGVQSITSDLISPPGEVKYYRISITAHNIAKLSQLVDHIGGWKLKDDTITREINTVTPKLMALLINAFRGKPSQPKNN